MTTVVTGDSFPLANNIFYIKLLSYAVIVFSTIKQKSCQDTKFPPNRTVGNVHYFSLPRRGQNPFPSFGDVIWGDVIQGRHWGRRRLRRRHVGINHFGMSFREASCREVI